MKLAKWNTSSCQTLSKKKDAQEIVRLIIRNFREVNVKDYGEKVIEELVFTHDVKWFQGMAEYANVYVFWNEEK